MILTRLIDLLWKCAHWQLLPLMDGKYFEPSWLQPTVIKPVTSKFRAEDTEYHQSDSTSSDYPSRPRVLSDATQISVALVVCLLRTVGIFWSKFTCLKLIHQLQLLAYVS